MVKSHDIINHKDRKVQKAKLLCDKHGKIMLMLRSERYDISVPEVYALFVDHTTNAIFD